MSESLESLKKQVIARLKELDQKEESKQLKKAIEYFSNSECLVNHLEKSISGEWIEKAGYGVGTIRVWKGKKYKKVSSSPVKWVRVFDKMDRGAKSSMTRLIHKVQACNSEDELYKFCLSHHSLFQDENGVDLPIMDKLRAAIDEQKGKNESGKSEKNINPFNMKDMSRSITVNNGIEEYKRQKKILNWDLEKLKKKIEKEYDFSDMSEEKKNNFLKSKFENLENQYNAAKDNIEYIKKQLVQISDKDGVNNIIAKMKKAGIYEEIMGKSEKNTADKKDSKYDVDKESESEKHQNRSDAMKGNDNTKKDNAKPTITFDRKGKLGEKAVNTKLSTENKKALDSLPEKFAIFNREVMKYPSEVDIDGEKKLAFTNGQFVVVTHDIPTGIKTKQSEKIEGNYPNVEKVIPKEFKDNSAPKVDINIDQVMKDLPKVDFSKKAFNDDSHKQFMKIGNFWYDAKMVKATYDMLKGDNAEVLESKDTYSDGRFGRLCIKTDKGYSVIVSSSNDYADNYKKQSIYNSDEGSMSASAKAEYESRKKTGLPDTYVNNAVEFGYKIDNKGFIHGEDKNITFKGKGDNTEFYYNGIPTGIKNRSSYMYGTKENIQIRIDAVKKQIENNIESYKEGKKNPANKPANYDATFPNMTDKDLTDIYKWWSNPKNIEEAIYKNSYKTKVPGLGSYGNDARKIGVVEDRVMDMLPDIKKEIARRGITIKKSLDGELIFESSIESYVKKSISILKKSLIG